MDFIQAIKEAGLEPPNNIGLDGRFHRFSSDGRPSDKPGWYVLNDLPDCAIAGAFGCWRNGLKKKWSSVEMSTLSKENQRQVREAIKDSIQKAERERKILQEKASKDAESLWEKSNPADPAHPYLIKKKVSPFDLRQNRRTGWISCLFHFLIWMANYGLYSISTLMAKNCFSRMAGRQA